MVRTHVAKGPELKVKTVVRETQNVISAVPGQVAVKWAIGGSEVEPALKVL